MVPDRPRLWEDGDREQRGVTFGEFERTYKLE